MLLPPYLAELLKERGIRYDSQDAARVLAEACGRPFLRLESSHVDWTSFSASFSLWQELRCLPTFFEDRLLVAVTPTPWDHAQCRLLQEKTRSDVRFIATSELAFDRVWGVLSSHYHAFKRSMSPSLKVSAPASPHFAWDLSLPPMDLLFQVLLKGFHLGAADINLESMEDRLDVRYQINGRYEIHSPLPLAYRDTLLESLFIFGERSFLKARPFTTCAGRLYIPDQDRYIRLRIEIQRGVHGYCAVCRPLDPHRLAPFLGRLPFGDARNALVKEILNRSGGLILIVGPTGSGKTTTLYGALTSVNVAEKNVRTIEDPVEYEIDGIIQNQIQEDSSFADGLRSMLRCNPDMILVGELRDHETASIAVRAALTGHLTLSTLHTFSAPDTVLRLLDMGISPDLLRMSLRMVISQRLLPILCPHCRQPRVPTDMEIERFRRFGVSVPPVVYDPNGCHICENRGYAGRRPLFEFLIVTPAVRDAIQTPFRISDFRKVWLSTGERPLVVPALEAAANGECSFDDAWRLAEDL